MRDETGKICFQSVLFFLYFIFERGISMRGLRNFKMVYAQFRAAILAISFQMIILGRQTRGAWLDEQPVSAFQSVHVSDHLIDIKPCVNCRFIFRINHNTAVSVMIIGVILGTYCPGPDKSRPFSFGCRDVQIRGFAVFPPDIPPIVPIHQR